MPIYLILFPLTKLVIYMDKKILASEIFKKSYIRGEFLLRSGTKSSEYFDKYQFESNPILLNEIANQLLTLIPKNIEILAALEMGGIPIATAIALKTGIPIVFVRKKAKEYGTRQIAEGMEIEGKHLLIIEDVVTSGGQIIQSVDELRNKGAIVEKAICVIDREQGGKDNLASSGIELISLFTMSELKLNV